MRLADITIGNTYVAGNKQQVNSGLYGVPVIVIAKGKFTTISQPCGQMIVPFEGDKRTELVVAVRACDANQLRPRNTWSPSLPYYRAPNNPYTAAEVTESARDGGRRVPYSLARDGQHWIPLIVPATKIMMSEDEFRTKEGPAREVFDAANAARERYEKAKNDYLRSIRDLRDKVASPRRPALKSRIDPNWQTYRLDNVTLSIDEYIKLVEKAGVRGTKGRIEAIQRERDNLKDAEKQRAAAISCVQKAGLGGRA